MGIFHHAYYHEYNTHYSLSLWPYLQPIRGVGEGGARGRLPPTFQVGGQRPSTFVQLTPILLNKNTA